jgi:hypothetical protein
MSIAVAFPPTEGVKPQRGTETSAEAEAEVRMSKKRRRYDLREFWLWYERGPNLDGSEAQRAVPPPFALGDIHRDEPQVPGRKRLQLLCILTAALLFVGVLWGLFR